MRIYFRPLHSRDRDIIERLHEEWFPVSYNNDFYNSIVVNKTLTGKPLFTCVLHVESDQLRYPKHCVYTNSELIMMKRFEMHYSYEPWDTLATSMEIKDGFMDTLHNKSFDILTNNENTPSKPFEKINLNNINNFWGKNGEEIIGCLVGSLVDISSCKTDQVESFVTNPRRHTRMMYIMTLGTILKYRHCGLATKLANICIQLAENIPSCGAIYLHVITDNNKAIRLYEKLGFLRVREVNDYYQIKGKNHNAYIYAKFMSSE